MSKDENKKLKICKSKFFNSAAETDVLDDILGNDEKFLTMISELENPKKEGKEKRKPTVFEIKSASRSGGESKHLQVSTAPINLLTISFIFLYSLSCA